MIRPLSQEDVHGDIDGDAHTAASTYGDGTCALHALFGLPVKGQLYAHGVREVFANSLKEDLSSTMACLPSLVHCGFFTRGRGLPGRLCPLGTAAES